MKKLFLFLLLIFSGCATVPYAPAPVVPTPGMPGIYHRVDKKETLWKISKLYNVDMDDLVRINKIPDASSIELGQLIFIPRQQAAQPSAPPRINSGEDFIWPLKGKVISTFGQTFNSMLNKGINIQPYKNSEICAARSGKVIFYNDNFFEFGKTVIIEHADGFSSVYSRNAEVFVKVGDFVSRGTKIARVGSSSKDNSIYLHFEIRKGHLPQNPFYYLPN